MPGELKKYYVVGPTIRHHTIRYRQDPNDVHRKIAEEQDFTVLNQEDIRKWFQHQEAHQLYTSFNEGPTTLRPQSKGFFKDSVSAYPVIFEVFIAQESASPSMGEVCMSSNLVMSKVYHGEQKEFYPKGYHSILAHPEEVTASQSSHPVLHGIKALFYHYEHPPFLSMHWRYQKQVAKMIEENLPDTLDFARDFLVEKRIELLHRPGFNPNGDLVRRLDFSISAVSNEILYRNDPTLKSKEEAAIKAAHAESKESKTLLTKVKDFLHFVRKREDVQPKKPRF